ncbi:uncharacterized protein LOC131245889 [Magnolia sinica]|uniref:uncharacterized protein LOC131245889 n=1 Tax=Magnolia sinica TaxID=86752 RepID=UPI00265A754C|nr:uncharacterized protein LOC131245889 [Magnolia sinica]
MGKPSLIFVALFLVGLAASAAEAGGVESKKSRVLLSEMRGFLYTRSRGRCTPQFWSSRREAWPRMAPQTASVARMFGSRALERYRWDLTLVEATDSNDEASNAFSDLIKQSTAALLNSYARDGFPYSPWEVKTLVIQALVSEEAAAHQAQRFSQANHACT